MSAQTCGNHSCDILFASWYSATVSVTFLRLETVAEHCSSLFTSVTALSSRLFTRIKTLDPPLTQYMIILETMHYGDNVQHHSSLLVLDSSTEQSLVVHCCHCIRCHCNPHSHWHQVRSQYNQTNLEHCCRVLRQHFTNVHGNSVKLQMETIPKSWQQIKCNCSE